MTNVVIMWVCAHPLEFVLGLVGACAALGFTLVPGLRQTDLHGHPRC